MQNTAYLRWHRVEVGTRLESPRTYHAALKKLLGVEPTTKLTVDDVKATVAGLPDITRSLAQANPVIRAAAYAEVGITVTYHQESLVLLESRPQPSGVLGDRVGGGT